MIFRKAILFIHGFAGGTYDEENLANYLELYKQYDTFQFTLPGHDKNLSKVKYQEWIKASEEKLEWLISKGYKEIYLLGHSMGGVIATYLASKFKEVKKLVLAAPAFQYLSVVNDDLNITSSIQATPKVIKTYGSDEILARFLKLNVSSIREFIDLTKKYYDYPKKVKCPTLVIQGKNDNLVPITSSEYVYNNIDCDIKKLVYVDDLTHDVFRSKRDKEVFELVANFFKCSDKGVKNI